MVDFDKVPCFPKRTILSESRLFQLQNQSHNKSEYCHQGYKRLSEIPASTSCKLGMSLLLGEIFRIAFPGNALGMRKRTVL